MNSYLRHYKPCIEDIIIAVFAHISNIEIFIIVNNNTEGKRHLHFSVFLSFSNIILVLVKPNIYMARLKYICKDSL